MLRPGQDYWQLFSSSYGPMTTAAEALDEDVRFIQQRARAVLGPRK